MEACCRGVDLEVTTDGLLVTLIDFTLSRLITSDSDIAFSDLNADPDLFKGPKGDCQVRSDTILPDTPCAEVQIFKQDQASQSRGREDIDGLLE